MEERLKRRKLDALRRGVHRVDDQLSSVATHVVGVGGAGIGLIAELLRQLEPDSPKLHALAIDIGDGDMAALRDLARAIPPERAAISCVTLDVPSRSTLLAALAGYQDGLRLEYPRYQWNEAFEPWLQSDCDLHPLDNHFGRAVAKAIYGASFYARPSKLEMDLRAFSQSVEACSGQPVVAIVFGLGGGTGSGIALDLARHLSTRMFGRRALVAGIGIAPCDGDLPAHNGSALFPVLSELDCLADEKKSSGVVMFCGELYRNPFTAGFILAPQQHVWQATGDLAATHRRVDAEIAALLVAQGGVNFLETLRMLNWVAAPSTQHSAARTPWGAHWIHVLGFADTEGDALSVGPEFQTRLGLGRDYTPEFIELRVADTDAAGPIADRIAQAFSPDVPPQVTAGGRPGSVQFILPCVEKHDLALFASARAAYAGQTRSRRVLDHAMLLEQGIVICEPSTCLVGMAGGTIGGGERWIAVPLGEIWGDRPGPQHPAEQLSSVA